ncbi:TonB-dependent receptor plug domain-containing protein [Niveispirillum sp.]|uniref:TonB-dependent receptor plug domain-containing protein n=1 Tax=Niveispirillum sp. TaxID=1917217 RepID=UPI001B62B280|nr:TonB-dependent receptor plug domain-containing protein [Niveispirillum sp.]MBP7339770.1 TonB-dependent receptor plug domain-containing protein [Niveispirillum sp.]
MNNRFSFRRMILAGLSLSALMAHATLAAAQDKTDETVALPRISVTDSVRSGAAPTAAETDGTGSYTSSAATLMGKEAVSIKEIPSSVSVITRQVMDDWNMVTLYDALSQATGVTAIPNDGTQAQYNSRGYGMNAMYNGIPSYNALSGNQQFDLSIYDRVEVLRGTAGMLMGTDPNPGGTVNMVTKRAKADFAATGTVSYGSWDNFRAMADVTGAVNAEKTLRVRAVASGQWRDYFYDHSDSNKQVGYLTAEYDIGEATTVTAKGAERIAACWAENRRVPQIVYKPDWTRHKKAAPFRRNDQMLETLPIGLIAFPGSGITQNLADKAHKMGVPVWRFGEGG